LDLHQLWTILSTPDNVPIVVLALAVPFYTWYGLRQSFANDRLIAQLEADPEMARTHHRKTQPWRAEWDREVHVWPYLLRIEFLAAIILTVILLVWSILLNAPLEEPANPTLTMNPAKAPWYFVGLQEMLVYFDPWLAGVVFPLLIIGGLMAIPYIDTNPLGSGYYTFKQRKSAILTFLFGFVALWLTMIFIGVFVRGPGWMWFWPGATWDHNRLVFEVNRDLPFGALFLAFYIALAVFTVHKLITRTAFNRKIYARMGRLQYLVMQFFLVLMLALPVKILLRLLFRIKYIWVTPWFNI
jgi:Cytochrome b(C-terminal)/b6/petD